jgi:hypothetical protein
MVDIVPLMPTSLLTPTIAWLTPEQAPLLDALASRVGLDLRLVGSVGHLDRPADDDRPTTDDPRVFVQHAFDDANAQPLALFLDPSPLDDPALLAAVPEAFRLHALGPTPTDVRELQTLRQRRLEAAPIFGLMRDARRFADVLDALGALGELRTVHVAIRTPASAWPASAALYDAMHLLHALLGLPESVDASTATARSLRDVRGNLTAHLRFARGLSATVSIAEQSGGWSRGMTIVAAEGTLRFTDAGFEIIGPDGAIRDRSSRADQAATQDVLSEHLARAIDPRLPSPEPYDRAEVLAMCGAVLLSARSGCAERPGDVLVMASG